MTFSEIWEKEGDEIASLRKNNKKNDHLYCNLWNVHVGELYFNDFDKAALSWLQEMFEIRKQTWNLSITFSNAQP